MGTEVYSGPLGEVRTISTAGGGQALTTTAAIIPFLVGTNWISLTARNFATAVVCKFALNPYLVVVKTTDALATAANLTDGSEALQDSGALSTTALTLNSLNTAANNNFVYVGSHQMFRGAKVTVGNTNSNASVLTVKYRKSNSTWGDITATDGTTSGGATLAQNGNVTWTVPSDWVAAPLSSLGANGIGDTSLALMILMQPFFWARWEVSAALDASVTVTEMYSLNRNTAQYAELLPGQTFETAVHRGMRGVSCVEALTDAGTANLIVNVGTRTSSGHLA